MSLYLIDLIMSTLHHIKNQVQIKGKRNFFCYIIITDTHLVNRVIPSIKMRSIIQILRYISMLILGWVDMQEELNEEIFETL